MPWNVPVYDAGGKIKDARVGSSAVASLTLTNTIASARNDRVELFGHAFARGDVPSGQTLGATVDSVAAPLQTMRTSTWPDGSLQFGVFAVDAGNFTASQSKTVELSTGGSAPSGSNIAIANLPVDASSNADLTLGAQTITVNRTNLTTPTGTLTNVFTGPHCAHWVYREAYTASARVYARFDIYAFRTASSGAVDRVEYAGGNEVTQIRIDEADHGTVASSVNRFRVNETNVLNETVPLYQYTRWWEHDFDLDIHCIHDVDYLSSTGVIWSYRSDFSVPGAAITAYGTAYTNNSGINESAGWRTDFSGGSTDPEIGPVPGQDVCYLISQSATMRDTMLRMHQRWGRHQVHMWDEDQGRPAQVGPNAGQHNTGTLNMNPDFTNSGGRWGTFASAGLTTDVAHMPRCGFVPYLISGRDWYREEMTFWANMACSNGNGAYVSATDYNLLCADQIRAEGWGMCQVAVAAALNPDGDSMKSHFEGAMSRHLSYTWNDNFAPDATSSGVFGWNQMGVVRDTPSIVGSGARFDGYWIPWQQDFMTLGSIWAWKLGFDGTGSLADYGDYSAWLCRSTVGKINKMGFQSAALYWCALRNSTYDHQDWSQLREDVYEFTEANSGALRPDYNDTGPLIPPGGSFAAPELAELQTGEPGSLAWRQAFYTDLGATQSIGFDLPASDIMITWAAISAAVERGAEGATEARTNYITISNKPDTEAGECEPQYDIEPTTGFPHTTEGPGSWIQANVPTDSTWQNVTSNLGNNLAIHDQANAYSGGGCGGGYIYVLGGGHNNGMNDAVAVLNLRRLDTEGWIEEIESTADLLGVADDAYASISAHTNTYYDESAGVIGGLRDSRGLVALSRHTYDGFAVTEDGDFYMYHGELPYDNSGQATPEWNNRETDMWKYTRGVGYSYLAERQAAATSGTTGSVCIDTLDTTRLWIRDTNSNLVPYSLTNDTFGSSVSSGGLWWEESFMGFNEDVGTEGSIYSGGGFGASNLTNFWNEYDINAGTWSSNRPGPSGTFARETYIFYVPARYGSNYGTYYCYVPATGTLHEWNGTGWDSVATGGPSTGNHIYGRCGFDEVHQVFYAIEYVSGAWQTWLVRPYAFE